MNTLKSTLIIVSIILFSSCVQDTHLKTIHFKLDMNGVENPFDVGVRGGNNPLSWNNTHFLTDENNDGIYEGVIELQSASFDIEFKFVNQNDVFELKESNNRSIRFDYKPETILYEAVFNNPKGKVTKNK